MNSYEKTEVYEIVITSSSNVNNSKTPSAFRFFVFERITVVYWDIHLKLLRLELNSTDTRTYVEHGVSQKLRCNLSHMTLLSRWNSVRKSSSKIQSNSGKKDSYGFDMLEFLFPKSYPHF